ncbi:MAG: hypothetical protein QOH09_302 [Pseudonocardiales bacterium]|nr:hypothetical protein [Pseudonocardiales bacterium]
MPAASRAAPRLAANPAQAPTSRSKSEAARRCELDDARPGVCLRTRPDMADRETGSVHQQHRVTEALLVAGTQLATQVKAGV